MTDDSPIAPSQAGPPAQVQSNFSIDDLIRHAVARKFHPVVIFGGTGSGKTAMILSLLRLLMDRPTGVGVYIEPGFFPTSFPQRMESLKDCYDYLGAIYNAFKNGSTVKSNFNKPFMLPISIKTNTPTPKIDDHIRVVLIDGMGEWFEADRANRGSDGSYVRDFRPELQAVLNPKNVRSLTTIFVSPHSTTEDGATPSGKIIDGLAGVIEKYQATRKSESLDWNLFLFSKWDRSSEARRDEHIWKPSLQHLEDQLQRRAQGAWAKYYNSSSMSHDRRYIMQYVSLIGESSGDIYTGPSASNSEQMILDHYGKILLNWIYANAAEATYGERVSLFPEVDAYRTSTMPFYDRVLGWIAGAHP